MYMKLSLFFSTCCLVLVIVSSVLSQTLGVAKLDYNIHDGLPGMQVTDLYQDSRSNIIVGTKGGACIFDGKRFHSHKTNFPLNIYSEVHRIVELSDKTLLFSTRDGIAKYNGRSTEVLPHSDTLRLDISFVKGKGDVIYFIHRQNDSEGQLDYKLYKLERDSFYPVDVVNKKLAGDNNMVSELAYDKKLNKVVVTYNKRGKYRAKYIALFDESENTFNTIAEYEIGEKNLYKLLLGEDGHVYFAYGSVICKIKENGVDSIMQLPSKGFGEHTRLVVNEDLFYSGGERGSELYKIEVGQDRKANITNIGGSFMLVNAMLLDRDNRLWLGREEGLSMIPNEAFWEYPYQDNFRGVWSIAQDRNNDLWFSSYGYGLTKYHYDKDSIEFIDLTQQNVLDEWGAQHLYCGSIVDVKGDIYFPMSRGALKYDVSRDEFLKLNSNSLNMSTLYAYEDNSKRYILFGAKHLMFHDKKKKFTDTLNVNRFGLNTHIRTINQDAKGTYWLGGEQGLWKGEIILDSLKRTRTQQIYLKGEKFEGGVISSFISKDGTFWLGTQRGLYQYKENQDTFMQELPPKLRGGVFFITQMSDSTLLLTSKYNLLVFNFKKTTFRSIGLAQGFTGIEFAQNGIMKDHEGYYWTSHSNKIIRFDPRKLPDPIPPKSYIVSFETNNGVGQEEQFNHIVGDTINSSINRIRIKFSANAFDVSEDFSFKVRLLGEGLDSTWKPHEEFFIDYDKLNWGSYVFEVKACSETTGCEENGTSLEFYIKPSRGEKYRNWIVVFCTLTLIAVIWFAMSIYFKRRNKKKLEQAQRQKEEVLMQIKAFNKQLDPHFLFNVLNNINGIIEQNYVQEATNNIVKLSNMLRASMERSQILFHTIEEELEFVKLYTEVARIRYPDKFIIKVDVSEEVGSDKLIPKMIIQSFVSNAIKHGIRTKEGVGTITIRIKKIDDAIRITVQDDGIGINATKDKQSQLIGTGQGQRLVEEIIDYINKQRKHYIQKASCKIVDKSDIGIGSGTLVTIHIPFELSVDKEGSLT